MGEIKLRPISELVKAESGQISEDFFPSINEIDDRMPAVLNVKAEISPELDVITEIVIKEEPKDVVDLKDNEVFPVNVTHDEKFKSVFQLLKRTIKIKQCLQCGIICPSKNDLLLHINQHRTISSTWNPTRSENYNSNAGIVCLRCNEKFSTYRQRWHHSFIHRNVSPFVCRYCNKRFPTANQANWHSTHAHKRAGALPIFVCRTCFLCFYQVRQYERHLRVHDPTFNCTICYQRFHHLNDFHGHLIEMHPSGMKVKVFDSSIKYEPERTESSSVKSETTSEISLVKSEISTLVKEEPEDNVGDGLQCERCAESFRCEKSFLAHMSRHMRSLKQFNCLHCRWFYFSTKRRLNKHTQRFHPNVGQLVVGGDDEGMAVENIQNAKENATVSCEDGYQVVSECSSESAVNENGTNNNEKQENTKGSSVLESSSILQLGKEFVIDEVGDVDMSDFTDLIKRFLN